MNKVLKKSAIQKQLLLKDCRNMGKIPKIRMEDG